MLQIIIKGLILWLNDTMLLTLNLGPLIPKRSLFEKSQKNPENELPILFRVNNS